MPSIPCLDCGELGPRSRCSRDARAVERRRHNRVYDTAAWRRASREAIAAWVRDHGWHCPGYGVPAHPSRDLTAGHPIALANGGAPIQAGLIVECRSCGSRRGARDVA